MKKEILKVIKKEDMGGGIIKYYLSNGTFRRYKGKVRIVGRDENIYKIFDEIISEL